MEKQSRSNWCFPNRVRLRWGRRESSPRSGLRTSSRTPQGWEKTTARTLMDVFKPGRKKLFDINTE
ncbi:hypothetical protein BDV24DRAFT_79539 [Aspergillus arachidicola]|uniref:Uncharacterized protein n=1 Tax=Aspergillus arachidicola TaxID=656916 RepID=A0A5N6Y3M7_9EURO|nr:hypothetical protein BDV24DRAFT_79539 [Aspergillus arachidicola]